MQLSPQFKERARKFRRSRRAFWSLILLLVFFAISLPAELLLNDKPFVLRYQGTLYYPMFREYTRQDFDAGSAVPIRNYRVFLNELETSPQRLTGRRGTEAGAPDRLVFELYGDDHEQVDIAALARLQDTGAAVYQDVDPLPPVLEEPDATFSASKIWALWPPIRYNYRTENRLYTTERSNLVSPLPYISEMTGERVPGAMQDGHWLGTDEQGRDVTARLVYGFRMSLLFGIGLALSGTVIGCMLGGVQGFFGGWTDLLGQRATEIWGSMPRLFLLIILSSFLANRATQLSDLQHFALLFGILNLTAWMGMATHMRAQFLQARNLDYVKAARALGQSNFNIMLRHILPNSLVPVVTFVPFAITAGITALVSLDFLGFGVKYPAPSLGNMLAQGHATLKWWILLPTFVIFSMTLILLTFVGDGVRNAFDPRHKG